MSEDQKKRLLSIYQLVESFTEAEEDAAGEELEVTESYVERMIAYVMMEAADWDEELFVDELVTRSEVEEAILAGPALMQEVFKEIAGIAKAGLTQWKSEFPECETLGEVMASMRSAGRA